MGKSKLQHVAGVLATHHVAGQGYMFCILNVLNIGEVTLCPAVGQVCVNHHRARAGAISHDC